MTHPPPTRSPLPAVLTGLGVAVLFEALTVLATQDHAVRSVSPWQADPYDAMVGPVQVVVPPLVAAVALRLAAWRRPGGPDRAAQTVRAVSAMTVLIGVALGFEWAAVARREHAAVWDGRTALLVAGLAVTSVLAVTAGALLVRRGRPRADRGPWRYDWLGDAVLLCRRMPILNALVTEPAARWVRRHATAVFVGLSLLVGGGVTAGQAVGERWTDPLLVVWMAAVETTMFLALCVIGNAVAGFVARGARGSAGRVAGVAVVAACVGIRLAVGFRDPVWTAVTGTVVTTVPILVGLTLGAGVVAAALACAVLAAGRRLR